MKTCSKCKEIKLLLAFSINNQNKDGLQCRCRNCMSDNYYEKERAWRLDYQKPYNKKTFIKNGAGKNKEKRKVYIVVMNAIAAGKLEKSNICEKCGIKCKTVAHHEDYSKPLGVNWVCRRCHGKLHRQEKY